jgi:hypothetical protein
VTIITTRHGIASEPLRRPRRIAERAAIFFLPLEDTRFRNTIPADPGLLTQQRSRRRRAVQVEDYLPAAHVPSLLRDKLSFDARSDFVAHPTEQLQAFLLRTGGMRRVIEAPVRAILRVWADRAGLVGGVAHGNHVLERRRLRQSSSSSSAE